ncbi:hypothetical protein EDC04DRAFT_2611820 [Pisolithus marmoratus]|nr:hypothetical protein EDC04DRAFT_2611820 [Pisolithus marmoratus]
MAWTSHSLLSQYLLVVLELGALALGHENNSPYAMSVLLSLMNEEVTLVYQALGHLEPAGEAVTLRKKLAPLLSNEVDSEDALPLPKTVARPSPDALASMHYDSPLQSPALWINSIRNSLVNSQETFEGNDLESIISRCQALRESDVTGQFLQMLAGIQLSFIYQELVNAEVDPGKRSKHEWLAAGAKFGQITASGSVYSLLLLSGLGLQSVAGRVHGLVHSDIATMLRSPQTAEPGMLASFHIPNLLVSILRVERADPAMNHTNNSSNIGGTLLDCTSFKESDCVLGGLKTLELQSPPRSSSAWQSCSPVFSEDGCAAGTAFSPQPSQSADIHPHPALPDPMPLDVTIIKMCYSHFHTLNTCFPAQHNQQGNVTWTNLYRGKAKQGSALELQNNDGSLMAFVCMAMPKGMKDLLFPSLIACLDGPDLFTARPSSLPAGDNTPPPFDCLHFSWYNRYTTKADRGFQDVFVWIGSMVGPFTFYGARAAYDVPCKLQVHLPEAEYEALAQVAESLPGNTVSAVEPFISLVININVQMEAHQDQFDKNLCLALAIGNFSGGGLVLHEQGLVLELQNGDFAVFCSSETIHFNLNYVGSILLWMPSTPNIGYYVKLGSSASAASITLGMMDAFA